MLKKNDNYKDTMKVVTSPGKIYSFGGTSWSY